jgi:nicotinate-nucleotide adenylyltransferase
MAMLQLLISDINPSRHNIQLYPELSHSRTLHTLEVARHLWQDPTFTLVIGSDLIYQLPSWYRVEELLAQVNLLVIPRPGYPLTEPILAELRRRGAKVAIADLTGPDVSSTDYREHGHSTALTPPVEAYIHREQLYPCQDVSREKQPIR